MTICLFMVLGFLLVKHKKNQSSASNIKNSAQENIGITANSRSETEFNKSVVISTNETDSNKRTIAGNVNDRDSSSLFKEAESGAIESDATIEKEEQPATKNIEFINHSKITVEAGASYFVLEGHDPRDGTTGRLLSGLSPKFFFAWQQMWSKKFSSKIFLGMQTINFEPEESGLTLKNSSLTSSRFGISFGSKISTSVEAFIDLGIDQALFYRGLVGGGIEINQVPLLRISPGLWWTLIEEEPFKVLLLGSISYWSASSYGFYSIEPGVSFGTGLRIEQNLNNSNIYCKLEYSEKRQNSSILKLNEKEAGFSCGLNWSVGL